MHDFNKLEFIHLFAFSTLLSFPRLFGFSLSVVFVGSFLLKPLVMRPVSFVWTRIVESDKSVFTLIFGFTGAAADEALLMKGQQALDGSAYELSMAHHRYRRIRSFYSRPRESGDPEHAPGLNRGASY